MLFTQHCNIFTCSCIKTEINHTNTYYQVFIVWQFSIHGRRVKGCGTSCFLTFFKFIHCINYWFVMLHYPKSGDACKTYIYHCVYISPKSKEKIDVIVLAKSFIEDLGDTIMNPALIRF